MKQLFTLVKKGFIILRLNLNAWQTNTGPLLKVGVKE